MIYVTPLTGYKNPPCDNKEIIVGLTGTMQGENKDKENTELIKSEIST